LTALAYARGLKNQVCEPCLILADLPLFIDEKREGNNKKLKQQTETT